MSEVSIVKEKPPLDYEKIKGMVKRAVDLIGGINKVVKPGNFVLIKPNIVYPAPSPTCTSPEVVKAIVELAKEVRQVRVAVGESSSFELKLRSISDRQCFEESGIAEVCRETGAEVLPFHEGEWVEVNIPNARVLKKAKIAKPVLECDVLIDVPVMKTHLATVVTLGIKNFHGVIHDDYKSVFHRGDLHQKLVDIHKKRKPDLTILDALKAMGGAGPGLFGDVAEWQRTFVDPNLIIASRDVAACDAVACAVMGIDPSEVTTNRLAHLQDIGCCDLSKITVKGNSIEDVQFRIKRAPDSITGQFGFLEVVEGGACRYCHESAFALLHYMKLEELLDKVLEKYGAITLIMGYKPSILSFEGIEGLPIIHGECAVLTLPPIPPPFRKRAVFARECPGVYPVIFQVLEQIREKVES